MNKFPVDIGALDESKCLCRYFLILAAGADDPSSVRRYSAAAEKAMRLLPDDFFFYRRRALGLKKAEFGHFRGKKGPARRFGDWNAVWATLPEDIFSLLKKNAAHMLKAGRPHACRPDALFANLYANIRGRRLFMVSACSAGALAAGGAKNFQDTAESSLFTPANLSLYPQTALTYGQAEESSLIPSPLPMPPEILRFKSESLAREN